MRFSEMSVDHHVKVHVLNFLQEQADNNRHNGMHGPKAWNQAWYYFKAERLSKDRSEVDFTKTGIKFWLQFDRIGDKIATAITQSCKEAGFDPPYAPGPEVVRSFVDPADRLQAVHDAKLANSGKKRQRAKKEPKEAAGAGASASAGQDDYDSSQHAGSYGHPGYGSQGSYGGPSYGHSPAHGSHGHGYGQAGYGAGQGYGTQAAAAGYGGAYGYGHDAAAGSGGAGSGSGSRAGAAAGAADGAAAGHVTGSSAKKPRTGRDSGSGLGSGASSGGAGAAGSSSSAKKPSSAAGAAGLRSDTMMLDFDDDDDDDDNEDAGGAVDKAPAKAAAPPSISSDDVACLDDDERGHGAGATGSVAAASAGGADYNKVGMGDDDDDALNVTIEDDDGIIDVEASLKAHEDAQARRASLGRASLGRASLGKTSSSMAIGGSTTGKSASLAAGASSGGTTHKPASGLGRPSMGPVDSLGLGLPGLSASPPGPGPSLGAAAGRASAGSGLAASSLPLLTPAPLSSTASLSAQYSSVAVRASMSHPGPDLAHPWRRFLQPSQFLTEGVDAVSGRGSTGAGAAGASAGDGAGAGASMGRSGGVSATGASARGAAASMRGQLAQGLSACGSGWAMKRLGAAPLVALPAAAPLSSGAAAGASATSSSTAKADGCLHAASATPTLLAAVPQLRASTGSRLSGARMRHAGCDFERPYYAYPFGNHPVPVELPGHGGAAHASAASASSAAGASSSSAAACPPLAVPYHHAPIKDPIVHLYVDVREKADTVYAAVQAARARLEPHIRARIVVKTATLPTGDFLWAAAPDNTHGGQTSGYATGSGPGAGSGTGYGSSGNQGYHSQYNSGSAQDRTVYDITGGAKAAFTGHVSGSSATGTTAAQLAGLQPIRPSGPRPIGAWSPGTAYVLGYVLERKEAKDFHHSIVGSSRYEGQQQAMRMCGLTRLLYLQESDLTSHGLSLSLQHHFSYENVKSMFEMEERLRSAASNTSVAGFHTLQTESLDHTARTLMSLTVTILEQARTRTDWAIPGHEVETWMGHVKETGRRFQARTAHNLLGAALLEVPRGPGKSAQRIRQAYLETICDSFPTLMTLLMTLEAVPAGPERDTYLRRIDPATLQVMPFDQYSENKLMKERQLAAKGAAAKTAARRSMTMGGGAAGASLAAGAAAAGHRSSLLGAAGGEDEGEDGAGASDGVDPWALPPALRGPFGTRKERVSLGWSENVVRFLFSKE